MLIIGPNSQSEKYSFLNELEQLRHINPQTEIDTNVKLRKKLYKSGMNRSQVDGIVGPSLYKSQKRINAEKRLEESKLAGEEGSLSDSERASTDIEQRNRTRAAASSRSYKKFLNQVQKAGRQSRRKEKAEVAEKTKKKKAVATA